MFNEYKLITGIIFVIIGIVLLYFELRTNKSGKKNSWEKSMTFKGIVAALAAILIGVVAILIHFGNGSKWCFLNIWSPLGSVPN